jgi:hypothetical protein
MEQVSAGVIRAVLVVGVLAGKSVTGKAKSFCHSLPFFLISP